MTLPRSVAPHDLSFDDPAPLPQPDEQGYVDFAGARLWCASFGDGAPVVLLHGALGNGDDWANQVPALVAAGRRVILIDNRGRGRSSPGDTPLSYELMAAEVVSVLDVLQISSAAVAGWSDGAIVALLMGMHAADRVDRVFAYAGNLDLSGGRPEPLFSPALDQAFARAKSDYARLSARPEDFKAVVGVMDALIHSQPNYTADEIAAISRPVAIVQGERDEFIRPEHAAYLARTIPDAQLITLAGVSHFAPWQQPDAFNASLIEFLSS